MKRFKSALVGFGRMAAGYADDPVNAKWFPYATHAQVLREHPAFDWCAVVDPSQQACDAAESRWGIAVTAAHVGALPNAAEIEVVVLATPPEARLGMLDRLPSLKAVVVEKPLGADLSAAEAFVRTCRQRGLVGVVNFPRRFDVELQKLRDGGLVDLLGVVQAVFGTYGNGLRNNGSHLIDLMQMLLGSPKTAAPVEGAKFFTEGPIPGDGNFAFTLVWSNGLTAAVQPLAFSAYREVGLDLWGTKGRLQILNESLTFLKTPVGANRQLSGAQEVNPEASELSYGALGKALYALYDNLAAHLREGEPLLCSLQDGLNAMTIVEQLMESHKP
jgi:predicted dehydrogenase